MIWANRYRVTSTLYGIRIRTQQPNYTLDSKARLLGEKRRCQSAMVCRDGQPPDRKELPSCSARLTLIRFSSARFESFQRIAQTSRSVAQDAGFRPLGIG